MADLPHPLGITPPRPLDDHRRPRAVRPNIPLAPPERLVCPLCTRRYLVARPDPTPGMCRWCWSPDPSTTDQRESTP